MSIGEIMNLYRDHELDIHPEFQRFFRWSAEQKSRFVESLLLGIPIPSIFVSQREDGVWDVVDGLQRLSTIFEFAGVLRDENDELLPPSSLTSTEYLPALAGKRWEDESGDGLSSAQRLILKRAPLDLKIIKRESDSDAQLDLFQRLNTGGSQLSDQELRNSLLIMVRRDFYYWLRELRQIDAFQTAIAASDRALEEQYDLELILRFLACKNANEEQLRTIGDMADFLTRSAIAFARDGEFDRDSESSLFAETFSVIAGALGDEAFRRYDLDKGRFLGGFSVSAFEAVSTGVAKHVAEWQALDEGERNKRLRERVETLWTQDVFRQNAGSGIRASSRIPKLIPSARTFFAP